MALGTIVPPPVPWFMVHVVGVTVISMYDGTAVTVTVAVEAANTPVAGNSPSIGLAAGETVTCTYTNTKIIDAKLGGTIIIKKIAVPNGPQVFEFGGNWGQFFMDDDGTNNNPFSNTHPINALPPCPYTIK